MRNNHKNDYPKSKKSRKIDPLDKRAISLIGVAARGRIPWKEREIFEDYCRLSEIEYAYNMSRCDKYFYTEGRMKGYPDYQRIAIEINTVYHNGHYTRDRYAVRNALYKYRKKLEGKL